MGGRLRLAVVLGSVQAVLIVVHRGPVTRTVTIVIRIPTSRILRIIPGHRHGQYIMMSGPRGWGGLETGRYRVTNGFLLAAFSLWTLDTIIFFFQLFPKSP